MSTAIVLRDTSVRDAALALVGSGFPRGDTTYEFVLCRRQSPRRCRVEKEIQEADGGEEAEAHGSSTPSTTTVLKLTVTSYAFEDHGVGGVVWPAAPLLAQYLLSSAHHHHYDLSPSSRVLELGCGNSALAGMAVAAAFGCEATCTDLPEVIRFARRNVTRNRAAVEAMLGGRCATRPLAWGEQRPWKATNPPTFDLILGADIVYRSELHVPLLQTLRSFCQARVDSASTSSSSSSSSSSSTSTTGSTATDAPPLPPPLLLPPPTRVLLAFQVRHPEEEDRLLGPLAASFGFAAEDVPLAGLPGRYGASTPWVEANMRIVRLSYTPSGG